MPRITQEEKIHDLTLLFVKKEMKKRHEVNKELWQKEVENMLDDDTKSCEFMETCWKKHVSD